MPTSTKTNTNKSEELEIGAEIPAFSLPATKIGKVDSAGLKGKTFVLYFYPKDDTPGCTKEACSFRDDFHAFSKLGVTIVGVSKDTLASHEEFAKKYGLAFPLASDEDGAVCEKFGVLKQKNVFGHTSLGIERSTFLIDATGVLRAVWRKVDVAGHADEVKQAIAAL